MRRCSNICSLDQLLHSRLVCFRLHLGVQTEIEHQLKGPASSAGSNPALAILHGKVAQWQRQRCVPPKNEAITPISVFTAER